MATRVGGEAATPCPGTPARMHGDEFVVPLSELSEPGEAQRVAQRLLGVINDPIDVAETMVP